jgi:hypothetical protein
LVYRFDPFGHGGVAGIAHVAGAVHLDITERATEVVDLGLGALEAGFRAIDGTTQANIQEAAPGVDYHSHPRVLFGSKVALQHVAAKHHLGARFSTCHHAGKQR